MAENTNYIGVAMGLDVSDLKSGLSEANKQIQLANSKFKAAASGMDDWTKSSEGLSAKIEQLDSVLKMQKSKLAGLKTEYEKVAAEQGENSEAARKLQIQINNQQAVVNKTEREFVNYKETLQGVEDGSIDLEKVTLKAGKVIKNFGEESEEASTAAEKLRKTVADQEKKLNDLKEEYLNVTLEQGKGSKAARELKAEIDELNDELDDNKKKLGDVGEEAKEASDGFTVAKGAVAGFIADALTGLVSWAKDGAAALLDLSDSTREYREDIGKLKTAWESAGKSTTLATKTYREFYSVLGEEDRSVEAVNHLAKFVETEKDMTKWTNIAAGVWGTFGDSLPIEGLTEASNETAKVGKLTGVLADALNWAGVNEDKFQESLDKCNTEQERAELITDTLNGLYEEAAVNYRKNNASVIKARNATADYNDALAELGETLEPVNADINEMKLELAKEFAPVLKSKVIPATKKFFDTLDDADALEKVGDGVAFVVENLDDILRVTVTAVGVWKTFTATMAITNTITTTTKAIKGLTEATSLASKAQIALNAAQKANLFGAIASLAATAVAGIATYALTARDGEKATDLLNESQREAVTAAQELAEAYDETKRAAAELAGQELANLGYTENLWKELQKLADKNGVVKKGYEDRANFILTELNKALGTEYTMNGNIIQQYGDMKKSIEEVILAKRAQILLTAHEESYKKAIENVAATEKARATQLQELAAQEEIVAQKRAEIKTQEELIANTADARTRMMYESQLTRIQGELTAEENKLTTLTDKYNETEGVLYGYYADIATYEKASTLIMQGETAKAVQYLDDLATNFKTVASTAELSADEQKKVLEQQVIDTEINARLMKQAYEDGVEGVTEEMVDTAEEQANKAKTEFEKVGGEITKGIAEGAEEESWTLSGAMESIIEKGLEAARKAAIIESPSKLFRKKVGRYIGQGVGVGVLDAIPDVKKDVQKFNNFLAENIGEDGVAGLSESIATSGGSFRRVTSAGMGAHAGAGAGGRVVHIDARQTLNYNGNMSLKEVKQREREHYVSIKTKLKAEGLV